MAKESMKLGEGFSAQKISSNGAPTTKPRHHVIGWGLIAAIVAAVAYFFSGSPAPVPQTMQERPGLTESLGHKLGGYLTIEQIRDGQVFRTFGPYRNTLVDEGETALRGWCNNNT